ncbi:MAG: PepSY-like domain-containing protein [Ginsengibacter sp.]
MKKILSFAVILFALINISFAQQNEGGHERINVPAAVKDANMKKYPESKTFHITWEKENGNYEANWGGKDGEANSVQYTPTGNFIEIVKAIPVSELPQNVITYVNQHYKGTKITEAGKVTDAKGNTSYEAEIKGKDVIFDKEGNFVKAEK